MDKAQTTDHYIGAENKGYSKYREQLVPFKKGLLIYSSSRRKVGCQNPPQKSLMWDTRTLQKEGASTTTCTPTADPAHLLFTNSIQILIQRLS